METFEAQTIDEAVAAALTAFQADRDQLEIQVLEQPRRGFLGIGHRNAKIKAALKQPAQVQPKQKPINEHAAFKADQNTEMTAKPASIKPKAKVESTAESALNQAGKQSSKPSANLKCKVNEADEIDAQEMERRHQINVQKMKQAAQALCEYLKDVLKALGVVAKPEIVKLKAHELTIDLQADNSGRVIGFHGRRINALEQLGTAFLNYHGVDDPGLVLDTSNYRKKRQQSLEKLAARCVTEVIATGQAVFLDPMPARERKYLHRVLEDNPRVKTYSHGRDPYRSVVVAPKN